MRSSLLLAAAAPALVAAAPPSVPKIVSISWSGNGCPNGDVKSSLNYLGDSAQFTFNGFKGDNTNNCAVHLQASGGSEGWQVALKEVEYRGDVSLKPESSLDTFTTVFWSQDAAKTNTLNGELVCTGDSIRDSFAIKSTAKSLVYSPCSNKEGYTGIMNVNFRPVIQGNGGEYNVKSATWALNWRQC